MSRPPKQSRERTATASLDNRQCVYTPCLLCGATDFVVISDRQDMSAQHRYLERFHRARLSKRWTSESLPSSLRDRTSFTHNYETHIVACRMCGLLCRNPHPPAEAVSAAYAHDSYAASHLHAEWQAQLAWARNKVRCVARHVKQRSNPRMIEVGSFVGGFLSAAREYGWDIMGVDPGEVVVHFCRSQGLSVFEGTFEQLSPRPEETDAVLIWNTFDQVPDPRVLLSSIVRALKPEGLLVLRVPHGHCYRTALSIARAHPWARDAVYTGLIWNNLLTFPYLYGYGLSTLDSLLEEFGLTRKAVYPDTLMQSAIPEMTWFATVEERMVKQLCRTTTALVTWMGDRRLSTAGWLDVYYRKEKRDRSEGL